ncbi:hypothetical protein JXA40_12145 [bacterium]|nr:hypothetical protein [candidate division CSSED10-310 bacterium]
MELRFFRKTAVPVLIFHMKPQYMHETDDEINRIDDFDIQLVSPDMICNF